MSRHAQWLAELGLSNFVAIDAETTGLDPTMDGLIEIAAVRFVNGVEQDTYSTLLQHSGDIPAFITELTGIKSEDLRDQPQFSAVAEKLKSFIGQSPIVGQNIEFDLGFLRSHSSSLKPAELARYFEFTDQFVIDTAQLSRVFWPEWPAFGLSSLCSRFGITLSRAHRALDDARATGEVLTAIVRQLPERVWSEFAQTLHRLIDGTGNRSALFFRELPRLCADLEEPKRATRDAESSNSNLSPITESLQECFGNSGMFSTRLEGYAVRPSQIEMAESVELALNDQEILVIEAPTGVGKSLAYLTPSLKWASQDKDGRRQIVVSSHTKALQEQLDRKDAALLSQAVGQVVSTAVLKGRNNYLCLRRLNALLKEASERLSEIDRVNIMPLMRWAMLTATGDVNEVGGFRPARFPHLWSQIASDSVTCTSSVCSAAKGDYYREAVDRANKATLIFVNHALLMTDPARFLSMAGRERALIIDEAHQLEGAVVSALTVELSAASFRDILQRVAEERGSKGILPRIARRLAAEADEVWAIVESVRRLYQMIKGAFASLAESLFRLSNGSRRSAKIRLRRDQPAMKLVRQSLEPLAEQWQILSDGMSRLEKLASAQGGDAKPSADLVAELASVNEKVASMGATLNGILNEHDEERVVAWIEFGRGRTATWCTLFSAPIDISTYMSSTFWPKCDRAILTSATLSVENRFDHFKAITGLQAFTARPVNTKSVSSPFNLPTQMRSFVPAYLSDPRTPEFVSQLHELIRGVVESEPRGTLILCTSIEVVEQLSDLLRPLLRRQERQLLTQSGSSSVIELVTQFREARTAVLIGASTLWEGIDVVGEALQILIIAKIPFDVPSEPWVEARGEQIQKNGGDPFRNYSIPVAAVRLKQGIGRLIRHTNDHGVAIVADPRLFNARYGSMIRRSIEPPMQSVSSLGELLANVNGFFASVKS